MPLLRAMRSKASLTTVGTLAAIYAFFIARLLLLDIVLIQLRYSGIIVTQKVNS